MHLPASCCGEDVKRCTWRELACPRDFRALQVTTRTRDNLSTMIQLSYRTDGQQELNSEVVVLSTIIDSNLDLAKMRPRKEFWMECISASRKHDESLSFWSDFCDENFFTRLCARAVYAHETRTRAHRSARLFSECRPINPAAFSAREGKTKTLQVSHGNSRGNKCPSTGRALSLLLSLLAYLSLSLSFMFYVPFHSLISPSRTKV